MSATDGLKGQISMEFMTYFGFLLLIFAIFAPIFFNQTVRVNRMREDLEANRIATTLEREINTAVRFGDGYSRNLTIPRSINNRNYTVSVLPDTRRIEVRWGNGARSRQIIGNNFEGSPDPGKNQIENSDGKIIFEEVP